MYSWKKTLFYYYGINPLYIYIKRCSWKWGISATGQHIGRSTLIPWFSRVRSCGTRGFSDGWSSNSTCTVQDGDGSDRWLQTKEEGVSTICRRFVRAAAWIPNDAPVQFQRCGSRLNIKPVKETQFNWERGHADPLRHQRRPQLLQSHTLRISVVGCCNTWAELGV